MKEFYEGSIKDFLESDVDFLEFDSECDLIFLKGILSYMGFQAGNVLLQDTIKPQFLPYYIGKTEVYLHFNPVVFRIGILKASSFDKIGDEGDLDTKVTLTTISEDISKNYTVKSCLVCSTLYEWLQDKSVKLIRYKDSLPSYIYPTVEDAKMLLKMFSDDTTPTEEMLLPIKHRQG